MRFLHLLTQLMVGFIAIPLQVITPVPKSPPQEMELSFKTNYGFLSIHEKLVTIEGDCSWKAVGWIRPDGSMFLEWTRIAGGAKYLALYHRKSCEVWQGVYGHLPDCGFDSDGKLVGTVHGDQITKVSE